MPLFFFSVTALAAALLVALSHYWTLLLPTLGIRVLYYRRELSFALTGLGVTLAVVVAGIAQSTRSFLLLGAIVLLLAIGELLRPARLLPPLDEPITAPDAHRPPDELLLAVDQDGPSRAWPVSLLRLHHVANDRVGAEPVAATW